MVRVIHRATALAVLLGVFQSLQPLYGRSEPGIRELSASNGLKAGAHLNLTRQGMDQVLVSAREYYTFLTQYERDTETGLDFAKARYFGNSFGRFTSPDPLMSSARPSIPQSWNRYTYALNSPLKFVDPSGMIWVYHDIDKKLGNQNGSRRLVFNKGNYTIDVEYEAGPGSAWRVAVDYGWHAK
jgi:RHS repeat-associated protein